MRLDETMAIAALIQATVAMLYKLHASNKSYRIYGRALLMENKFRASRYGLDGNLIDFGKEEEVPVRDLMEEYLRPDRRRWWMSLDSREEIDYIHQMLKMGTGADRQLKVYEETGDLKQGRGLHRRRDARRGLRSDRRAAVENYGGVETPPPESSTFERTVLIQPVLTDLTKTTFDAELSPGAHNAVNTCLRIQPWEKVTLITDNACREIAASIAQELLQVGSPFKAFVLEDIAPRPLVELPPEIAADMETSQVSIFAVQVQRNELKSRMQMTDIVNRRRMRHAHMVNINRQIMLEGMRADFNRVDALSKKVIEIVSKAKEIRAKNPAGSDFSATLNPNYRWVKTSGIISPDKWGNLPGGEVFTTPGEVNGTYVVDGVVGDYLCEKYPDLAHQPLNHPHARTIASPRSSATTRFWKRSSGPTPTPTKTAIWSASSPSEPTSNSSTSSGRSCKTRNFPACTSRSETPMARTPARTGIPAPTSTSWARTSISGLTAGKSWRRAAS